MRIRIGDRLFIGFLLATVIVLAPMTVLTRWYFHRGFIEYVNESEVDRLRFLSANLERFYEKERSWDVLEGDQERWRKLLAPPPAFERLDNISSPDSRYEIDVSEDPFAISPRVTVLDRHGNHLFGPPISNGATQTVPILFGDEVVGNLQVSPLRTLAREVDTSFAQEQNDWYLGSALAAILLAGILAAIFARPMLLPILELTRGTRALTGGKYFQRINVESQDEIGDLARDFNTLAQTLERHEELQREWIANISHELRTPLTILRGVLHGIEDGVCELNEATRKSLASEVDRLTKLVDDIYDLSVSDIGALRYRKETNDVTDILSEIIEMFEVRIADAKLTLRLEPPAGPLFALVDRGRLGQLFTNLVENSIRYTNAGGQILISCKTNGRSLKIDFEDSAPGVAMEQLPRLFDRLYRADSSRRRSTGGAGLGLAICKNIAQAHAGEISASQSALGGLRIRVMLPIDPNAGS